MRLVHSYSAIKLYEQCGLRYYRQRILKDAHEQETVHTTHGHNVHSALENNLKTSKAIPKELAVHTGVANTVRKSVSKSQLLAPEKNMGLDNKWQPTGYWSDDIYLRAKLDVLVTGGPTAVVIDWKTGKRKADYTQLKIAAIAVFQTFAETLQVKTGFAWLKFNVMDRADFKREEVPTLIDEIQPRIDAIQEAQENNVWKPNPSYLCTWCPCKPTCPYAEK